MFRIQKIIIERFPYLLIFFLLLGISGQVSAETIATINAPDLVEIEKDRIVLGKIAKIESENPGLNQKLRAIVIGKAPLPGKSCRISRNQIKIRLKQNHIDLSQIKLQVPEKIKVSRSFIKIPAEKIKKVVLGFLNKKMPWDKDCTGVKKIRISQEVILPKGDVTYKIVLPENMDLLSSIPVSAIFYVDGVFQKKIWAMVEIEVLAEVVFVKKPIGRFQPITEDHIYLKKMDITKLPPNIIINCEEVLGKRAKRKINPKTVLRTDLIELPPLVKRGDIVMIIAESESLRIATLGEVREKGRKGERISVVNVDSKKELYARVLNSNTVRVDF